METIKVDILNPKARKLLKDLADKDLIAIRKPGADQFPKVLNEIRRKSKPKPPLDEISKEVDYVRTDRHKSK